jgi:hypothetical protein
MLRNSEPGEGHSKSALPAGVEPAVGRRSPAVMLGGLSLLGPLSIDAYLPAFADIQRDFQASTADLQLTLTGYLLAFACMSLVHGLRRKRNSRGSNSEARRVLKRLQFRHTPKHASWLNMVESEIGVLRSQCLDRRIDDKETILTEVAAWEKRRNAEGARIQWMFTTEKAREKLRKAYPVKES